MGCSRLWFFVICGTVCGTVAFVLIMSNKITFATPFIAATIVCCARLDKEPSPYQRGLEAANLVLANRNRRTR